MIVDLKKLNPFETAQRQLDKCAAHLKLQPGLCNALRVPMRELHFSIPVKMDDKTVEVFQGYRVQYNDALGPTKGGIRFHQDETIDTVRALAAWMTWKTSLLGLPLGGGKGGVICNPKRLSQGELERLSRGYVRAAARMLGPDYDVPAPDVYTTPQIMAWMMDEYSTIQGKNQFGVITGKPLSLGGSLGREDATARGGWYAAREAAKKLGMELKGATVAIQGYGNAGYFAASLGKSLFGCKIVAVCDSRGGIYNKNGLDPESVREHKIQTGSVAHFPGSSELFQPEVLKADVDILIPAALENTIHAVNAEDVRAKMIVELANGPTTPEADEILYRNGIHVIPDFLANAGGVTVSYFEMVQNYYMYSWSLEEVHEKLDRKMTEAYQAVYALAELQKVDMRQAAYIVAVKRVVEAMKTRGWV